MNIKCLLFGHRADCKMMNSPMPSYTRPHLSKDMFGNLKYHPPIIIGWLFYGYVAICTRCQKPFDADDLDLPILEENDNSQTKSQP